jgi:FkbM family methyltransferase
VNSRRVCRLVPRNLELPGFAHRYRGAFRSGSGSTTTGLTRFANRVLYYLSAFVTRSPAAGRFRLLVRGEERQIEFNCRNLQFNALYFEKYQGGYEPDVSAAIIELLPGDGVFYDVGSNWGYFSLLVASRPEFRGRVHAFEPWPSSFEDVRSVIEQAGLADIVTCHPLALSEETGTSGMAAGRHSGLAHLSRTGSGTVNVRTSRLDDLDLEPPDVMKIDTEGTELQILNGGERTIARARPFIVFENSLEGQRWEALEVLLVLEQRGYRLFVPMLQFRTPDGAALMVSTYSSPPPQSSYDRLALQPLTRRSRPAFPEYINLVAAPEEKLGIVEQLL